MKTTKDGRRHRKQIIEYLKAYREEQGYSPSIREIAVWTGIPTTSVFYHLSVLEREGIITRKEGQARTWKLVT